MTDFHLQKYDQIWSISLQKKVVAEILLDFREQVDEVLLYADSAPEVQHQVLTLAASHAVQYVRRRERSVMGGLMVARSENQELTDADSIRFMDFGLIPENLKALDRETLSEILRQTGIDIVLSAYADINEAITDAIKQVGVEMTCESVDRRRGFDNELTLAFSVKKPLEFIFWKSESKPTHKEHELYLVPNYHPVMNGWKPVGMVNGDTDAYISSDAIRSLRAPKEARTKSDNDIFGSSWGHVNHPFHAKGRSITVGIVTSKMRSKEGVDTLVKMLRAALGLDNTYVEISGGFKPPLRCAHNRVVELGIRSPYPRADNSRTGHLTRGSEAHCVWAYRTLKKEGVLDKAFIPSWFQKEGWLNIYKGAKVEAGLY